MYIKIDKEILSQMTQGAYIEFISLHEDELDTPGRIPTTDETLEKIKQSENYFYITFCPKCRNGGLLSTTKKPRLKTDPSACVFCGEVDPIYKYQFNCGKVDLLIELVNKNVEECNERDFISNKDKHIKRILKEQCIVILATGAEIFLKETYATLMNSHFVKDSENLYYHFYDEVENRFTNFDKGNILFKRGLDIDLRNELSNEDIKQIRLIFEKRHLIVHNNGITDRAFIKRTGLNYDIRQLVPIEIDEIKEDVDVLSRLINQIKNIYDEIISKELMANFNKTAKSNSFNIDVQQGN